MPNAAAPSTRSILFAVPLLCALLVAGCGGDDEDTQQATAAPAASAFPAPDGKTLEELVADSTESDLVILPAQQVLHPGADRFGFGVFTVEGDNVPDAQIALYAAKPNGKAAGPFPASSAMLETAPAFRSETTSRDPDAATVVYTSEVDFPTKGEWRVLAMVRDADGNYSSTYIPSQAEVGQFPDVPQPGDKAPVIHTPTADDVGGDLTKIDTRQPPGSMHDTDFADVVGKEPVVLMFATPALCTSRVCGPVVDVTEEVKAERPDDAAFIQMEIYKDNNPSKGPREQVEDFNLPSEPWLYVIDADGKISTAIEGAFSADELNAAIDKVAD